MNKNKLLKSIRIDSETYNLLIQTLELLNKSSSGLKLSIADLRRWAYKDFCNKVLTDGLVLEFMPK